MREAKQRDRDKHRGGIMGKELIDRFWIEDEHGGRYEVFEYQEWVDAKTSGDPNAMLRGIKSYRRADGGPISEMADGFEIDGSLDSTRPARRA
jgi:hypothetical protein